MKLLRFLKWFVYLVCKLNACINVSVWSKDKYNKTPDQILFSYSFIMFRNSHRRCSVKKCFQKFRKIHTKTPVGVFFLIKVQVSKPTTFSKETPTPVFSCEFREIFKNTLFTDAMYYCDIYYLQCVPFIATNCHYTSYQNNKSTKI